MRKPSTTTRKSINLFFFHALRYKTLFFPLVAGICLASLAMNFLEPYIVSLILQKISRKAYDAGNLWGSFGPYIIAFAVVTFTSGVLIWRLNIWLLWHLELKVSRDISTRTFNHLMDLGSNFHNNRFAGSLVSQSTKLTGAYVRFMDATLFNLLTLILALAATIIILTPRVPLYAACLVFLSVIFVVGTVRFSRPVREANRLEAEAQSRQTGYLADGISNLMVIKSFAAGKYEKQRYAEVSEETRQAGLVSMKRTTLRETYSSTVTSTIAVLSVVIAVLGARAFEADIATLFLIVSYTSTVGERLWQFQNVLRQYNRSFGDASDMVQILDIVPDVLDPKKPEKPKIARGSINFKNVTFTHHESHAPLFTNLNLRIKAGEKIGLVGHSGSGKTSLSRILLRFADIDSGAIEIDGQDIRKITQDDLHARIAYVPQEPLLFHRSLAENIAYGRKDVPMQEIEAIARMANAHEFIETLPDGYETLVGERGVKLSGGQRQRVAIARAMLKNAPILMLDEATSALDSESEILIQEALWKLMEGRTAIVIAHRLSTIQKMDRIIVLEDGGITEQGSHRELVRAGGSYARLWAHQSGGFIEA